jgi:hypothetical protein
MVDLIKRLRLEALGSMHPHSTATTVIPRRSYASLSEGCASHGTDVGQSHLEGRPHLSIRVPGETDPRNWPPTASGEVIRGVQGEWRWIIGPSAPPDPATHDILTPRTLPTLLAYKSHLTLAGTEDTPQELHISPLLYLRVGSSVVGSWSWVELVSGFWRRLIQSSGTTLVSFLY